MAAVAVEKARYEAMIMAIGDGVSLQDREFRIIYQNRILKDLVGNQEGEHCFMSYEGNLVVCDGCPLREAFADGKVHKAERSVRLDDVDRYMELTASPVLNAQGDIIAGIEIVRDITDRKNMEERLATSERKFRMLFNHAPDVIFIHAPDGRILEASDAAVEKLGYGRERLMAMSIHDIASPVHPGKMQERIREILAHGSLIFETGLGAGNGTVIPIEASSRLINFEGNEAILSYCRDITERKKAETSLKESEERWQFALEGSGAGVWDWNIVSGKVFFSERWKSMLGFGPRDFPENENLWHRLVHPDDRSWVSEELKRHLRDDIPVYMTEHRLRCRDGSWKWILDRGKVMARDAEGAPLRMVGTYSDITDRKRLEEQLRQAQKMEAVGELAGGIAHDFNNILTAIIGRIYLLQTKLSDREDLLTHADQIAYAAERAANLTKSLLAFSREQIINLQRIDLNETVIKSGKLFSKLVREDMEITMTPASSNPNGHIDVYSEPGAGTTFRIYLPAVEGEAEQAERTDSAPLPSGQGTILVAENEDSVRTLTRTILSECGYQVIEAENGIEAVVKFRENQHRIDAVLLDVIMPRMNGKEARDEILKTRPDAKILFMSGYTGDILGQQGLLAEETGLIQKPLKPRDLLTKLGKLLG